MLNWKELEYFERVGLDVKNGYDPSVNPSPAFMCDFS